MGRYELTTMKMLPFQAYPAGAVEFVALTGDQRVLRMTRPLSPRALGQAKGVERGKEMQKDFCLITFRSVCGRVSMWTTPTLLIEFTIRE